jgi:hypothetical protein
MSGTKVDNVATPSAISYARGRSFCKMDGRMDRCEPWILQGACPSTLHSKTCAALQLQIERALRAGRGPAARIRWLCFVGQWWYGWVWSVDLVNVTVHRDELNKVTFLFLNNERGLEHCDWTGVLGGESASRNLMSDWSTIGLSARHSGGRDADNGR